MENVKIADRTRIYERAKKKTVNETIKRGFDLVCSILALVVFSPLLLILMIVIKLDSKGPIFFSHKRLGHKGKLIKVYKFRTMVANAEEVLNNLPPEQKKEFYMNFKLENDPRITKIGNFLRRSSLDELPQLFNIIKGDMSIVGPRPIVEKELEKYGEFAEKFLSVIPGLTGYWQCNGRSDTTYEERVQMDMHYIDNRSMFLDIKIILQTVVVVIRKEGAV